MADSKVEILLEMNSRLEGINAAISRMDQAQKKATRLDRAMGSLGRVFKSGARAVGQFVKVAALTVVAAGTVFAADSLRKYAEFESRMKGVEAVLKPTTKELGALEAEAKKLGRTTKFSAREASAGIEILAKNGVKTEAILGGVLASSLKLSASVGADLPEAADTLTDALQVFNLTAADSARVVDSINAVTINSKFGFEDYQAALANGGASAVAAGQSFEDFNTAITATASFFANGETAGTSYKAFLDSFTKDNKKAEQAQKLLGLSLFEANGDFKDMADVAGQLDRAFDKLNPEQRAKAFNDLFSKRGKNFAIGLARAGEEGVKSARFLSQFADATAQAEKRLEGTQGSLTKFKSAFEGLQIAIGKPLAAAGTPFIDAFSIALSDLSGDAESAEEALTDFFTSTIVSSASLLDTIANTVEMVKWLSLNARAAVVSATGTDKEKSAMMIEQSIFEREERDGNEFTVAAMKIAKTAAILKKVNAELRDEEAKFTDLIKISQEASGKGNASETDRLAIEKAVVAQSKILDQKKDQIDRIKGINSEEESEEKRSLEAKVQLSFESNAALASAVEAEKQLRIERGKLSSLMRDEGLGLGQANSPESSPEVKAQAAIVEARLENAKAARKSADEIVKAEQEVIESSKISAKKFKELAQAAGLSSDRVVSALQGMSTDGVSYIRSVDKEMKNLQSTMEKTTRAGEKFQNDATENSWLKDFALDGVDFLKGLVNLGFDPLQKKLSTITNAGVIAGGLATSSFAASPTAQVAGGDSGVAGIAQGLLGEDESLRLRFENERATVLEESAITAQQRSELLLGLEAEHQRNVQALKQNEQAQERQINQQRLGAASDAFGNLSVLMRSENKKAFKIGKAAAIAQATINMYQSATGAFAALASIPYVGPILGAAAAAAALVAGGANIASISSQQPPQFFDGGFVGGDNAKPASFDNRLIQAADGEFIVNNRAAQANRALLQAINSGANPLSALRANQPEPRAVPIILPELAGSRNEDSQSRAPQVNFLFSEDDMMDKLEQSGRLESYVENFLNENSTRFGS